METTLDNETTRNKIFLRWVNWYLRRRKKKAKSFAALADGILLAELLEIVSQSGLPVRTINYPKEKEKESVLSNIKISLSFLRSKTTIQITELDIYNEREQPGNNIRDLVWSIILIYHFGMPRSNPKKLKEDLIRWLNMHAINIEKDIVQDTMDGSLIFKLANLIQFDVRGKTNPGVQKALKIVTKKFNIPDILTAEDLEPSKVDEIAVLVYIGFFVKSVPKSDTSSPKNNDSIRRRTSKGAPDIASPRTTSTRSPKKPIPSFQEESESKSYLTSSETKRKLSRSESDVSEHKLFDYSIADNFSKILRELPEKASSRRLRKESVRTLHNHTESESSVSSPLSERYRSPSDSADTHKIKKQPKRSKTVRTQSSKYSENDRIISPPISTSSRRTVDVDYSNSRNSTSPRTDSSGSRPRTRSGDGSLKKFSVREMKRSYSGGNRGHLISKAIPEFYRIERPFSAVYPGTLVQVLIRCIKESSKFRNIEFEANVMNASNQEIPFEIRDQDTYYYLQFTPPSEELLRVEVKLSKKHILGSPLVIPVSEGT